MTDRWGFSCKIALRWMPLDLTDDKSTLVQVMAWCRQARSHYLSQCWPGSMTPYGVNRPQWVIAILFNSLAHGRWGNNFKLVISKFISKIYLTHLVLLPQGLNDDKSTLAQVKGWCCQATSHCLNQYWPSSMMLYVVSRPQCVDKESNDKG